MLWVIVILFQFATATQEPLEKFQQCHNQQCILIQCYFPVSEFLNATKTEVKLFEHFLERHHLFVDYRLCHDLSVDSIDEMGACIYGVLFKLYQFDANGTVHQRVHVQRVQIQDECIALVIDMISNILYGVQSVVNSNKLDKIIQDSNDENVVVVYGQSLRALDHLSVSRTILNYGQWFNFIYSIDLKHEKFDNCLYRIYPLRNGTQEHQCATQENIRVILEQYIGMRKRPLNAVQSFFDFTHVNIFERSSSTLFYINKKSKFTLISHKNIPVIPVNISNFPKEDIENHVFLHGPYPFYLFWSAKKNTFQRLGDQPSDQLMNTLLQEEQQQDFRDENGLFDDEVRRLADSFDDVETDPNVFFLQKPDDYRRVREQHEKHAVLLTVKWSATSKLARRTFHQLAANLHKFISMIDIDCFDWTDVCADENVIEWPTLLLVENGKPTKTYQGSTDKDEVGLSLFRFSVSQPFQIENDSSEALVESFLARQRVIVLAKIRHGEEPLYNTYKNLIDMFSDNEHIFFMFQYSTESSSLIIKQKYSGDVDSLLQSKKSVYSLNNDVNELKALIIEALQLPVIPFDPIDIVKSTPTILLVASQSQLARFHEYLLSTKDSTAVWIDTNSVWVLTTNEYGHIPYPAIIYIDYETGKVYMNSTLNDIGKWLEAARSQAIRPFYEMLSADIDDRPSQPAINFQKNKNDPYYLHESKIIHEESEMLNEHGLGFDMNGLPVKTQYE